MGISNNVTQLISSYRQAAPTGNTYRLHLQAAPTGNTYRLPLQVAPTAQATPTGNTYRQHRQAAPTGCRYRQAPTGNTYRQHLQATPVRPQAVPTGCTYSNTTGCRGGSTYRLHSDCMRILSNVIYSLHTVTQCCLYVCAYVTCKHAYMCFMLANVCLYGYLYACFGATDLTSVLRV